MRPRGSSSRDTGSQRALRSRNERSVLETLMRSGPQTQAQLSKSTGLSPATVSNIVRELVSQNRVERRSVTSSGRRASQVRAVADGRVAVGVAIGRRHLRVMLMGIDHREEAFREENLPAQHGAATTITRASELVHQILAEHDLGPEEVIGTGVALPAPIDPTTNDVVEPRILPEWSGLDLIDLMTGTMPAPVIIDNDANLGALAHLHYADASERGSLIYLKLSDGIGAGLIIDGQIIRGFRGGAGEIGHVSLDPWGAYCPCGNRGCLETFSSIPAIRQAVGRTLGMTEDPELEEIHRRRSDPALARILDDAGRSVGRAVAMLATVFNPERIVVGGPLAELGDVIINPITQEAKRHWLPGLTAGVSIEVCTLGSRVDAAGACALVLRAAGEL
ncbi:MAG: ROK family transcriptional regulator [Flaviflexus sp.]|nr:ROK family transcriptional regulator [Flaviflexus sp.]